MNSFFKAALFPAVICVFCLIGCTTLPSKALYREPTAAGVTVNTTDNHFDVVYAIDCCLMPKAKDDFMSFKVDTMLYTYRLDFYITYGMKDILDRFFTISALADSQQRQNGHRYLGETTLYTYAVSGKTISRLVAHGRVANHVRFSFLLKDGKKYLLLEGFQVKTLDGKLPIDDYIDSIPFHYEDIKKAYDFFCNAENLETTRQKQLQIALTAAQLEQDRQASIEKTEHTDAVGNSEKSPPKGQ